jgi:hypothetical protein
LAATTTVPAPESVNVLPLTVAGPEVTEYVTARPELAVAASVMAYPPNVWLPGLGKVIV